MSRDLTNDAETASLAAHVIPVMFLELAVDSGTLRTNSADRTLSFDGMDFTGIGDLGKISTISEPTDLAVEGLAIEVSGIPSTYIDMALSEPIQGRSARVWVGFIDSTDYSLLDAPVLLFRGRMDVMDVTSGKDPIVTIRVENRFADWDRPRIRRYTDADQRARFPNDKGCEFVTQTAVREIVWGRG